MLTATTVDGDTANDPDATVVPGAASAGAGAGGVVVVVEGSAAVDAAEPIVEIGVVGDVTGCLALESEAVADATVSCEASLAALPQALMSTVAATAATRR